MDGLLNTCHASLINIQSSPSRKCPPGPRGPLRAAPRVAHEPLSKEAKRAAATTAGGKSFNIYRLSRATPLAPPGPGTTDQRIRIRDGASRFAGNIRIQRRQRPARDYRTAKPNVAPGVALLFAFHRTRRTPPSLDYLFPHFSLTFLCDFCALSAATATIRATDACIYRRESVVGEKRTVGRR